jgi:hypothetical protein
VLDYVSVQIAAAMQSSPPDTGAQMWPPAAASTSIPPADAALAHAEQAASWQGQLDALLSQRSDAQQPAVAAGQSVHASTINHCNACVCAVQHTAGAAEALAGLLSPCLSAGLLDLISLMHIDWRAGFSCPCALRWHTADAIAIGMNAKHCFIERPHETPASNDHDRVAGNTLQNRLFVVRPDMRQKLLLLGSSTSGGRAPAAFEQLKDSISALPAADQGGTLLQLLQTTVAAADGNLLAVEHWRRTIHSLDSTAPVDQLLPLVLWDVMDTLLGDNSPMLSAGQQLDLRRFSPLLQPNPAPQPQRRTTSERPRLPGCAAEGWYRVDLARTSIPLSCT